jgi:Protein kinase domain
LSDMARTKLTTEAVTRYGVQIADALAHAHDRQVVHRDLKGANVVITHDGRVKVLDFGLARRLEQATVDAITRAQASVERDRAIAGTLPYMAPEVLTGETASYQSDIWALGVLLYEAATGQLPFEGSTSYGLSAAILHELPRPLPASVPPGLTAVIMRCLTKDLKDRFQRASEIRSALETIQSAAIVSAPRREEPAGPRTLVLRGIQHLDVKNGDVLLLLGTTKGAFLVRSRQDRKHWDVAGPYFHGHAVYSLIYDGRNGRHRLWASTGSLLWGTFLRSSDDFGKTWTNPLEANLKFPPESGLALKNIWKIALAPPETPDTLYCGVEPTALFESHDAGESWSLVRGLFDHPHRPRWMPGQGGLCLHTILAHPTQPGRMMSESRRQAFTAPMMPAGPGKRATEASASRSCPSGFRSSDSACTRSFAIRIGRSACFCKTTGVYIAPMTAPTPGTTSPMVCRRILASPWRFIRTSPTPFTSCPWNRMNSAALPRGACASIARGALGLPGNR